MWTKVVVCELFKAWTRQHEQDRSTEENSHILANLSTWSVVHSTLLLRIVLKRLMCELTYWKVETKIPPALLTHVQHVFGVSRSSRYRWRACKQSDQSIRDLQFNFSSIYMYQSLCSYVLLESFNFCQILVLLFFIYYFIIWPTNGASTFALKV